ncbi:unnamed protein product [Diatraea saccharalis]|uniref:Uncharacterized protein n=1 Tax=Diatraea saccharalis TaxID=40085 RepID=A0A9N9RA92_9NEOP|nr:unnamed protein product [Diatraea saccharalis]
MKILIWPLCLCILLRPVLCGDPIGPLVNLIRTNLVGYPVIHDKTQWIFDPDVALRRRKQFVELHGDKAERLIERLGLGIDGRADERLIKQRQRDEGHLGGLNYFLP